MSMQAKPNARQSRQSIFARRRTRRRGMLQPAEILLIEVDAIAGQGIRTVGAVVPTVAAVPMHGQAQSMCATAQPVSLARSLCNLRPLPCKTRPNLFSGD
uniref:Uncharacterized protein n=1 Tax=mine drainage metagenome TaxID=410659 RepID=E6PZH0_9ZZZZ